QAGECEDRGCVVAICRTWPHQQFHHQSQLYHIPLYTLFWCKSSHSHGNIQVPDAAKMKLAMTVCKSSFQEVFSLYVLRIKNMLNTINRLVTDVFNMLTILQQ